MDVSTAFFDADLILNLPKFKTHGLTYITGAVKNLFGAIYGLQKSKMHSLLLLYGYLSGRGHYQEKGSAAVDAAYVVVKGAGDRETPVMD